MAKRELLIAARDLAQAILDCDLVKGAVRSDAIALVLRCGLALAVLD